MAEQNKSTEPFFLPSDLEEQRQPSVVERPDYQPKSTFRLPSETAPAKPDYEKMPLSEAAMKAIPAAPQSLVNQILGIPQMLMHPSETWEGIKAVGKGALSSIAEKEISALESGAAGETGKKLAAQWRAKDVRTPEQKAEIEDPYNRFIAPYTTMAGFKETLATDPFAVVPLGGGPLRGVGAALRGGEGASLARKVIAAPVKAAGYAVDPVEGALSLAGGTVRKGISGAKTGAAGFTQVPEEAIDIAYMTGKSRGPQPDLAKQSFSDWFNGQGDINNFSTRSLKSFEAIKNEQFNKWKAEKTALTGSVPGDVPFEPIIKSIDDKIATYGPYDLAQESARKSIDALNQLKGNLYQRSRLPSGHVGKSVEGLDQLKVQLGKEAENNPALYGDYMAAYHGVKNAIADVAPEYQTLMDSYREMDRQMRTIQGAIKAKDTNTALQSLAAFTKLLKTPEGMQIAKLINEKDPTILPAVAGAALSKDMPKLQGILDKTGIGGALLTTVGAIAAGYPTTAAVAAGAIPVLSAIQTPRRVGQVAYKAGQIAGSPVGKGIAGAGQFARQAASPTATFMENLRRTQEDLEKYPEPQANGGRIGRAAGGRIDVQRGVRALMRAAENAKKSISKTTEPLLDQPDEHIAQALDMAKKHI